MKINKLYLNKFLKFCILIGIPILAIYLIFGVFFNLIMVHGSSMYPTLKSGNIIVIKCSNIVTYGDIVVAKTSDNLIVKRVIALAGDSVDITEGNVYINGVMLDESAYLNSEVITNAGIDLSYPHTVKENCVFLMGDNRQVSSDSRTNNIGDVSLTKIIGVVQK